MKKRQWITRLSAIMLLTLVLISSPVLAGKGFGPSSSVMVEIISDDRGMLPQYDAGLGDPYSRRSYIAVRNDERYRIRVTNRSGERIGLVIAVDGRNIISGRMSSLGPHERMYILAPYQSGDYEGWRTGKNRVNRFYFTGMSDSYAGAWGDYSAMGVIAVAAYPERHRHRFDSMNKPWKKSPMGPRAHGYQEDPGTGFGEGGWSPSRTVQFTPRQKPAFREFIKYEWRSTLCRRGVITCRKHDRRRRWNRFWPEPFQEPGFAPFPPPFRPFR